MRCETLERARIGIMQALNRHVERPSMRRARKRIGGHANWPATARALIRDITVCYFGTA